MLVMACNVWKKNEKRSYPQCIGNGDMTVSHKVVQGLLYNFFDNIAVHEYTFSNNASNISFDLLVGALPLKASVIGRLVVTLDGSGWVIKFNSLSWTSDI